MPTTRRAVASLFLAGICALTLGCRRGDSPAAAVDAPLTAGSGSSTLVPHAPAPPVRIVCLTPSATEIVAALGATDRIVGVDTFSDYPVSVKSLPKTGDFLRPDLEAILALRPDLVIGDDIHRPLEATLEAARIPVLLLPMSTLDDVRAGLAVVGARLELADRAKAVGDEMTAALTPPAGSNKPLRVLYVIDRSPGGLAGLVAAGPGTYADQLITAAGGVNVLAYSPVAYPQVDAETLYKGDPDVIVDALPGQTHEQARLAWSSMPKLDAVRKGRVHALGDSVFLRPNPRVHLAVDALRGILARAP